VAPSHYFNATCPEPAVRGSAPRQAGNRPRIFELGLHSILQDYFGVDGLPPVYGQREFERRFRVPVPMLLCIYHAMKDRRFFGTERELDQAAASSSSLKSGCCVRGAGLWGVVQSRGRVRAAFQFNDMSGGDALHGVHCGRV